MKNLQLISLVTALAITLTLPACGNDAGDDNADENATTNGDGTPNQGDDQTDCLPTEIIDKTIKSDTTLGPRDDNCPAYTVDGQLQVQATLTVEPGTIVEFEEGAQLIFMKESRLIAKGTNDKPILFTATKKEPGWWRGIFLRRPGTSLDSQLEHITIEYGGFDDSANLTVGGSSSADDAAISIKNTTLQKSSATGLILNSLATLQAFDTNTLSDNQGLGLAIHTNHVPLLDTNSTYTGNGQDSILINASIPLNQNATWKNLDPQISYLVDGFFEARADLTIEPGTTIAFNPASGIRVMSEGRLQALGTEQDSILFTAANTDEGWLGLVISRSEDDNHIKHATVEYAGATQFRTISAAIQIGDSKSASATIEDSTIQHSKGYGIYARSNTTTNENICDANQFSDNTDDDCLIEE